MENFRKLEIHNNLQGRLLRFMTNDGIGKWHLDLRSSSLRFLLNGMQIGLEINVYVFDVLSIGLLRFLRAFANRYSRKGRNSRQILRYLERAITQPPSDRLINELLGIFFVPAPAAGRLKSRQSRDTVHRRS